MAIDERRVGLAISWDRSLISYSDMTLVSSLVKAAMIEGGLGQNDPEAPLCDIIEPGMTVLLKPNWVLHCNKGGHGMDCMVTNPAFIEAALAEVLKAKPGRVIIADAPIQSTVFEKLVPETWINKLQAMGGDCPVEIIDFRKCIWKEHAMGGKVEKGPRSDDSYSLFDLGQDSLLESISTPEGRFRNTCYDPAALERTHQPGCHKYLLSREFFEADLVLNLPKLKAHRKAGLTAAIKNLVGINGDKDYLPHHRLGGSAEGGDCYEGGMILKHVAETLYDKANRRLNTSAYLPLAKTGSAFLHLNKLVTGDGELEGGWYGNDTVWRMVLDLNRVALYGRSDGSLSKTPVRNVYSLTDAIIAGEGFGPLAPEPIKLGAVTFSASSASADLAHATLMRFDWGKIPSVRHAFDDFTYPLTSHKPEDVVFHVDGGQLTLNELSRKYGMSFKPPRGWAGHIEMT